MSAHITETLRVALNTEPVILQPMRTDWPSAALRCLARNAPVVRVLVTGVRGSAPREPGACMLVTGNAIEGTIGGGHLEWRALHAARSLLSADPSDPGARCLQFTLGRDLSQCCGGVVELWMERLGRADAAILRRAATAARACQPAALRTVLRANGVTREVSVGVAPSQHVCLEQSQGTTSLVERLDSPRTAVWLYGAGHVGQAIVRTISDLPLQITWLDPREPLFPRRVPENVEVFHGPLTAETLACAPGSAYHLVMTHDHALDYAVCSTILRRDEFAWLGLIGSRSKGARFRSRLRRDGFSAERVARLVSPIGLTEIDSKHPTAIAIGVAAQLLQVSRARVRAASGDAGVPDCRAASCASCALTTVASASEAGTR